MRTVYDALRDNFHEWEARGRGTLTFGAPVSPRPPFIPFRGHRLRLPPKPDGGRRPTGVSGFLSRLTSSVREPLSGPPALPSEPENETLEPHWIKKEPTPLEIVMRLPATFQPSREAISSFWTSISLCDEPLAFEIVGTDQKIWAQWVAAMEDWPEVERQLTAHFPSVALESTRDSLADAWGAADDAETVIVDFALGREFMWPLGNPDSDQFVGLIGALAQLEPSELGVYQVIFTPVPDIWADAAQRAVVDESGKPFFSDGAEIVKATEKKVSRPLYGVVVRLAARAPELKRAWQIIRGMAPALRALSRRSGNEFIPLRNDDYPEAEHAADVLLRWSCRCGMILNLDELTALAHFPTPAVQSKKFLRTSEGTRRAPSDTAAGSISLGLNEHHGRAEEVCLPTEERLRHMHIIGGTGSGKSTLLFNLLQQGVEAGEGLALFDPHGDLVDRVLGAIPEHRWKDVVLIDPSDEYFVVPFNVLSAKSDLEKTLLSSDLVSIFERLSTSWGDQMDSVFRNAVLAFLESSQGGSLNDLERFLVDGSWREEFLNTVEDAKVRFYWRRTFPHLGGGKSIGPILTRLQGLVQPKLLRYMVGQKENRLDFAEIMDSGKILLLKLSQGLIGPANAYLLGSFFMAKLQQTAMSRQRMDASLRRPFFVYVDEAQEFITPSMREILTGTRKYGLGLVFAHHELRQLDSNKDVGSALLSGAGIRVVFKVGDGDARTLAEGFEHFESKDIQRLPVGQALCRIGRADNDFNLRIPLPDPPDPSEVALNRAGAVAASQARYARLKTEVAAEFDRALEEDERAENGLRPQKPKPSPAPEPADKGVAEREVPEGAAEEEPARDAAGEVAASTSAATPESPAAREKTPAPPGKGGHQHGIVQERLKAAAEKKGFRAILEMTVGNGNETTDVGLVRSDLRIACEISITTTVDQEVGNIHKCLRGGFDMVLWICGDPRKRAGVAEAIRAHFGAEDAEKVKLVTSHEAVDFIDQLSDPPVSAGKVPTRGGIKVTRKFPDHLSKEERARLNDNGFRVLAEEMQKLPPDPPENPS